MIKRILLFVCVHFSCLVIANAQEIHIEPSILFKNQNAVFYITEISGALEWRVIGQTTVLISTNSDNPNYVFPTSGTFTISCKKGSNTYTKVIEVLDCESDLTCTGCLKSFGPTKGKRYAISAWASQSNAAQVNNFTWPEIRIQTSYNDWEIFKPSGAVIDGWQRVYGEFFLDASVQVFQIVLTSNATGVSNFAYFDDIRIHPLDGNMKSYVYDPITLRLVAELDNNNFSTFYEYDEEGKLIRVKKETVDGIVTIKENRNNSFKIE